VTTAISIAIMLVTITIGVVLAWWLGRRDLRQGAAVKVERSEMQVQSAEEAEIERVNKLNLERLLEETQRK
jgi:Mg2+/citrate symporter